MKTFNLIKWLWTDSHEKQSPQRFARFAAMLIMLLTLGVGQMWAAPWVCSKTTGNVKIATKTVGDKLNGGSEWLFKYETNGGWSSATDIQALVGISSSQYTSVNGAWEYDSGSNRGVKVDIGDVTFDKSGYWCAIGKYYADSKTAYTTSKDSWTDNSSITFDKTKQPYWEVTPPTVKSFAVSTDGSDILSGTGTTDDPYIISYNGSLVLTLSGSKNKTDINSSLQYYTNSAWNTTTSRTISSITSTTKTSVTVKMRCYNSTASLSGTESTKTIYYQAEPSYTVSFTNDGNGSTTPSSNTTVGAVSGVSISADADDGYNFNNWTITSGTGSFADATDESTTFYPTSTATIRANFVSAATSTLTVTATTGGSITTPAAGYYSDITTTGYSIAASRSEGYKFTGWTKTAGDGAVSFSDASSLSTTATITTLGDVTVTAGFAAMSNSLSVSSSTLYAGDNITLSATRTNHSLNLTYQYKIGSGSWTDIATQSGTSKTWQIPYANTYQTYKFRVKSTDGSTSFYSAEQTVNVKGRIIIHVKNTNSWASLYLYSWYSSTATNGAWPGKTGTGLNNQSCSIHATGSQWWDVTITQETATAQKFILNKNGSYNQDKTDDLLLSDFEHDAYYAMSTNGSAVQTLSTTTTPAAPTVSTLTAGTIRETSAVLGGNIANAAALGNDIITERGYYWSTNSALSSSNLGVGTKVTISGTQSAAGNFSSTKSSLTAGTKYYFLAYAKNGYGTGYSSVQNFTTLSTYTVTVTAGAGGSASPSSVTAGQYQLSGTITASASTGYTFYNWTKTSGSGTVTFTNANAASTTLTSTNTATVRANFVDTWNLKGDQWGSDWSEYKPLTATANANEYSVSLSLTKGTKYQFKVVKRAYNGSAEGTTDTWYGTTDGAGNKVFERGESAFTTVANGMDNNLEVTADVTGTYTFTISTSGSTPVITVTYPTAYTVTFGKGTGGGTITASATSAGGSFTSGSYVASGDDVTFAQTASSSGYTFSGWYTTKDTGGSPVTGMGVGDHVLENVTSNKTVWSRYTANNYTVTFDAATNGGSCGTASKSVTFGSAYGELPVATHASRTFIGWYTTANDDSEVGTRVTEETIVSTADNHKLFARFESTFEVVVQYKCGGVTLYPGTKVYASATSLAADISAPEILGYQFNNWTGSNATFVNSSSANTKVNASAATTITANYTAKDVVYFKNNLGWEKVYVTFDPTWSSDAPCNNGKPYYEMTQLGSSDIFYCNIPESYTASSYTSWAWNIAFDNHGFSASANVGTFSGGFNTGEFLGRGDFDPKATMFIPYNGDTEACNGGTKYNTGCWMKYNSTDPGYKVYANTYVSGSGSAVGGTPVLLTADVAGGFEFKATVYLLSASYTYGFMLGKEILKNTNDLWYSNGGTITSSTNTLPWHFATKVDGNAVTSTGKRCGLTTEAVGDYEFTVSFGTGRPVVNVTYPVSTGDYRLIYNDRVAWSGSAHDASWFHPSRVIKARANAEDIVSFFVSKATGANANVKIQTCTGIDGSGNPTWNAGTLVDISSITKTGIYNFKVSQNVSKVATVTVDGGYTGNYYIRTDVSDGGWSNYKTSGTNTMTYSEYSETHGGDFGPYSHYFMRFVNKGSNIKFCIANDYSECISDTCVSDSYTNEWIEAYGNVRFMWYHGTNKIGRAYISGSSNVSDRFLVLEGDDKLYNEAGTALTTGQGRVSGLNEYEMNFIDDQNWIYETTVQAKPTERIKLTAKYNNKIQYFYGAEGARSTSTTEQLLGGSGTDKYKIRVVYDFKTNRLIKAFIPENAISTDLEIDADLMIIREHQNDAQQITFNEGGALSKVKTVYGAMRFNKWTVNNKSKEVGHETLALSRYERDLFYISFPFDVELRDAFGFGTYGTHWIIEYYDGKGRAEKGFWADSPSNWKFVSPSQRNSGYTLKAFEGYILALDLDEMTESSSVWNNGVENVYVYFPSSAEVKDIDATSRLVPIDQEGYQCTIGPRFAGGDDRRVKDSYWHVIGVPSFANYSRDLHVTNGGTTIDWRSTSMPYLYEWVPASNTLSITKSATYSFKPTFAYMVQYSGASIYWDQVNVTPASVAARYYEDAPQDVEFRLELQQGEQKADQAFVRLSNNDAVTSAFDFNFDLAKEKNKNTANIYTMVTSVINDTASVTETAGNCLPLSNQTTVVPVGVTIKTAGDYTFAIPDGTNGVGVTLVDTENNIRTSLSALSYTVNLSAGTHDGRFILEIAPIQQTPTDIDLINGENGENGVRKMLIDQQMYIIRDGKIYDARGARVQ